MPSLCDLTSHTVTLLCSAPLPLLQMRVLQLQVSELERSIHTSKVSMPDLPGIDRDIAILKADLLRVRGGASDK